LSVGFIAWKDNVADIVRREKILRKALIFMRHSLAVRVFKAWSTMSKESSRSRFFIRSIVQAKRDLLHALGLDLEPEFSSINDFSDLSEVNAALETLVSRINASQPFSKAIPSNAAFRAPKAFELVTSADVAALRELFKNDASPVWYTVRKLLRTAQFFGVDHTMSLLVQHSQAHLGASRSVSPALFDDKEADYQESKEGSTFVHEAPYNSSSMSTSPTTTKRRSSSYSSSSSSPHGFNSLSSLTRPMATPLFSPRTQNMVSEYEKSSAAATAKMTANLQVSVSQRALQASEALSSQIQASRAAFQTPSSNTTAGSIGAGKVDAPFGQRFEVALSVANARFNEVLKHDLIKK
jgi:hypothetical protein